MTGAHVCASLGAELLLADRHATEPLAQQPRQRAAQGGVSGLPLAFLVAHLVALVLVAGICLWMIGGSWPRTR